jgi:hypothetical protein
LVEWKIITVAIHRVAGLACCSVILFSSFTADFGELPEQQEAIGSRQGIRQALQFGHGERQRNVDRGPAGIKGTEEGKTD